MAVITMRQMLEAGVHFGHQTRRWNPKMKRFIFGERNGIYIIDLEQTLARVEAAYNFVRDLVAGGGTILFVGTKKQAQDPVRSYAEKCGMPYVNERWLGGMLTNFETISKRVDKMLEYERMQASGEFDVDAQEGSAAARPRAREAAEQPRWSPRHEAGVRTRSSCSTPRRSTSPSPRPTSSGSRSSPSSTPTSTPTSCSSRSRATTTPSAPTPCSPESSPTPSRRAATSPPSGIRSRRRRSEVPRTRRRSRRRRPTPARGRPGPGRARRAAASAQARSGD